MTLENSSSSDAADSSKKEVFRLSSPLLPSNTEGSFASTRRTAMVILNTPIAKPPSPLFEYLWKSSSFHVCADGGANRLWEATKDIISTTHTSTTNSSSGKEESLCYLPDVIRGDLDSLRDSVRDYYASKGVLIEQDPDQDTNDLDKALQKIVAARNFDASTSSDTPTPFPYDQVIIYGGFGGRFDQEMASFQALYKWADTFQNRIWLYSDETSAVLVPAKRRVEIAVPYQERSMNQNAFAGKTRSIVIQEGPTCGLIPMGCKCESMTTSGLKWDLQETESEFGGLVSTSNHIIGDDRGVIIVEASHPVIFTAEIIVRGGGAKDERADDQEATRSSS